MSNLGSVRARIGAFAAQLRYVPRVVALVWRAAPRLTAWWFVLLVAGAGLPVATVLLTKRLVDSLVGAMGHGGGWERFQGPMLLAGAMAGLILAAELLQAVTRWVRTAQAEHVKDHVSDLVQRTSVRLDLAYYESPEYFDQLHRVLYNLSNHPVALVESLGLLLQSTLTLAAMVAVLARFGVWIPLALAVSTVPALLVVLRYTVRNHEWRLRTTAEERRAMYFQWLLTAQQSASEVRLFGLGEHYRRAYVALRANLRRERVALAREEGLAELAGSGAAFLIAGAALAAMVWRTLSGRASLGDLAMFYQAFNRGQQLLRGSLDTVRQLYTASLFLSDLFEFLSLEPEVTDPPAERRRTFSLTKGISFRGITFRYPGAERPALSGFDLEIPAGQVVAVVGPNGAGKSTLLKLLCRLYDPDEGVVLVDGVDVRDIPLEELRGRISVLFQEPLHFSATARENIELGAVAAPPNERAAEAAAVAAGADAAIRRLSRGYDTLLGKWFAGGEELSVGEWQRLALARAFYREAPIVILDEPTSAMDSWAENEWMDRFRRLVAGRTALVVTHRFTTAMRADVIHVMEAGRIAESGDHAALLSRDGLYAASWRGQMSPFRPSTPGTPREG